MGGRVIGRGQVTEARGARTATAIVLAGGRSRRFGSEKMAHEIGGQPLLHRALRAVAEVCQEVLVVASPNGLPVKLPADLPTAPTVVRDEAAYEGPLVAFAGAAARARHERLLLVAGDMPALQPAVLRRLLSWPPERTGACLLLAGRPQPMPAGFERDVAAVAARLVEAGERRLRTLMASLDLEPVSEAEWRALDPDALSLCDLDRPGTAATG
jgi:molybdopterin-guanine dinucleotide biosynthesis protein A